MFSHIMVAFNEPHISHDESILGERALVDCITSPLKLGLITSTYFFYQKSILIVEKVKLIFNCERWRRFRNMKIYFD